MFFVVSKIFWMFLSPVAVLLIAALIGAWQSQGRFPRTGRTIALAAILVLLVAAMTPLGLILVSPLEDRFPQPPPGLPPPYGIIVLGGAINGPTSAARGQAAGEEEERVVQAAILAKRYPEAKIVFTGGSGSLFGVEPTEATEAKKLLIELGVDPARILLEGKSSNTAQNARFTAAIVHPEPSQPWLIVTSAFHMPRAMGAFRKAGFDAIAYPVAYRTPQPWEIDSSRNLRLFEIAVHEWIGLLAYWATGRTGQLFPAPSLG
ncbi:MAG: YdcF family protein [Hyphomicrobiales bacterium]|nr:YdcF family protein [Hyphomicrobiales bacterium]